MIAFEASSLEEGGYPIKVGMSVWSHPGAEISSWSTLIRPADEWVARGYWDCEAAFVDGIEPLELDGETSPDLVAQALNDRIPSGTGWCDALAFDMHWMGMLFEAANVQPSFMLRSWHVLLEQLSVNGRETALNYAEREPSAHRPVADSEALLGAIALGIEESNEDVRV